MTNMEHLTICRDYWSKEIQQVVERAINCKELTPAVAEWYVSEVKGLENKIYGMLGYAYACNDISNKEQMKLFNETMAYARDAIDTIHAARKR